MSNRILGNAGIVATMASVPLTSVLLLLSANPGTGVPLGHGSTVDAAGSAYELAIQQEESTGNAFDVADVHATLVDMRLGAVMMDVGARLATQVAETDRELIQHLHSNLWNLI